jgi:N-acetylmuramoyl-L-alanine amidase
MRVPMRTMSVMAALAMTVLANAPATARSSRILVDVGHSRTSGGSTSATGVAEFEYNRALALEVVRQLRGKGHVVGIPNAEGGVRDLQSRPRSATTMGADLFLSIHHDSIQERLKPWSRSYSGFSTWASGATATSAASTRCAQSIGASMAAGGMRPALYHAERIQGESRNLQDASTGRYRRDDLAVLRLSRTPAVLVEAGVIVNPDEEAWLSRQDVRRGIAAAIVSGVEACLRR